jgi:hypothetical protein
MAHTIRCGRAKHDRCKCECGGAHHGEEATELDRTDPEPLDVNPAPLLPGDERIRPHIGHDPIVQPLDYVELRRRDQTRLMLA